MDTNEQPLLQPGFLGAGQSLDKKLLWVSLPYRGHNLHILLRELEQNFGISSKRYMQFDTAILDTNIQEDSLRIVRYARQRRKKVYAILVNELGKEGISNFFVRNRVPVITISLTEEVESLRIALIAALKHVSSPF
ncbi:TPA: hypothetical protein DDX30_01310 [Candidatus Wolfebacteria bacterium]|nr:hypothetical protein [Candidatus Wolfebacteria bacterium]